MPMAGWSASWKGTAFQGLFARPQSLAEVSSEYPQGFRRDRLEIVFHHLFPVAAEPHPSSVLAPSALSR